MKRIVLGGDFLTGLVENLHIVSTKNTFYYSGEIFIYCDSYFLGVFKFKTAPKKEKTPFEEEFFSLKKGYLIGFYIDKNNFADYVLQKIVLSGFEGQDAFVLNPAGFARGDLIESRVLFPIKKYYA